MATIIFMPFGVMICYFGAKIIAPPVHKYLDGEIEYLVRDRPMTRDELSEDVEPPWEV